MVIPIIVKAACLSVIASCLLTLVACSQPVEIDFSGPLGSWQSVGGSPGAMQYSQATQINSDNVDQLELAWEYAIPLYEADTLITQFQLVPILANNTLYGCSSTADVFAINPSTGKQLWYYDAKDIHNPVFAFPVKCRGVSYWQENSLNDDTTKHCQKRIYAPTSEPALIALDADSGERCKDFGDNGKVNLLTQIGGDTNQGYGPTSAPIIAGDLIIVGSRVNDNAALDIASGVVRAFDIRSGELRWAWNPVHPEHPQTTINKNGVEQYSSGTVNSWAPMSVDEDNGLLFVPTGNPSPDLYGGDRNGSDYYGSSVVALNLGDGSVRWSFQTVHNDVWDYDVPAAPALFQHAEVGKGQLALAQATKAGNIFLLDRLTGKPLYPVEERAVPQGGVPGENLSPTQPFATHPENIHPQDIEPWGITPWDKNQCAKALQDLRWEGPFTPPSLQGSVLFPGASGGMNWGGVSINPEQAILLVNQSHLAWVTKLIKREDMKNYDPKDYGFPDSLYPMEGSPYGAVRSPFTSPLGAPCNQTPWGTITAVDLISGKVIWSKALGFPEWMGLGTPNFGGVMSTAGGIAFATGTLDNTVRAFDIRSGDELWSEGLGGQSWVPPISYRQKKDALQYVIFAVKGSDSDKKPDRLLAYALRKD